MAYASPQISIAMLFNPIFVIQGVYIKHFEFSMTAMAFVMLGSRIFDAVTDPLIGYFSDQRKARTGKRKDLVALGAILILVAGCCIYMPPGEPSIVYFTLWLFVFYLGFTIYSIPHVIWAGEIASESSDKKRIFAFHTAAGYVGLVLFYSLPLLSIFETSEITPQTMKLSAILGVAIMTPALFSCLRFVPEGSTPAQQPGEGCKSVSVAETARIIFGNKVFLIFMASFLFSSFGLVVWYSMIFIFVDIYLGAGALFSPLYLISFGIGIGVAFVAERIARIFGAKTAWRISVLAATFSVVMTSFLSPEIANAFMLLLALLGTTIAFVTTYVVGRAILAEIIDYSILKERENLGASYFSIWIFSEKIILAVGGALGLGLAAMLGFDPAAAVQDVNGVRALAVVMSWLPGASLLVAFFLIGQIPMDERRHAIIRKRLDARAQRAARAQEACE